MPGELTVKVEVRQDHIAIAIWERVVSIFGVDSIMARLVWWFFEPLEMNIANRGWERIDIYRRDVDWKYKPPRPVFKVDE